MWDLAFLILHVDIGTMQDEKRAELGAPLLGSLVERSKVPAVGGIDWTVILDQQGGHIHMLGGREGGREGGEKNINHMHAVFL
jgi:hypothetical protein